LLCHTLERLNYEIRHFLSIGVFTCPLWFFVLTISYMLSPMDFGIPNERLRYYCLAKHKPLTFKCFGEDGNYNNQILMHIPGSNLYKSPIKKIGEFLDNSELVPSSCELPEKFYKTFGYRFDLVASGWDHSTCFTKGYGKNFKGSGPILVLPTNSSTNDNNITINQTDINNHTNTYGKRVFPLFTNEELRNLNVRLFSPREIAGLLHFPQTFCFPSNKPTKQCYQLLGNSINVSIVSELLVYLLS